MKATGMFGQPLRRSEDPLLLTGKAAYLADHIRPEMAAMRVVRSPVPHARIRAIDCSAIAAHPDCLGVLTAAELPAGTGVLPALDLVEGSAPVHQRILAGEIVRYVGEPVAVVIGTDAYVAEDLAERVVVQYESLAPIRTAPEGIESGAPLLYPDLGSNIVHQTTQLVGDPCGAFAAADTIIEQTFRFQRVTASALELRGAIATIEPASGRYLIYSSTQIPQLLRTELARITGIGAGNLRVVTPQVGGGFGAKEAIYPEEVLVLLALQKFGRPVYWLEDRQESFSATIHGREETISLRMAVQADGTITALEAECLADIGACYSLLSNTPGAALATVRGPYRIPNFRSRARSVVTNKTPLNVYRGAGHPQTVLSMERMMDLAAAATGLDRAEVRRRNLLPPEAFPVDRGVSYPGCGRIVFDSGNFPALLHSTLEAIGYEGFARRRRSAAPHMALGLGITFVVEMTGGGGDEPAGIRLSPDGKLHLLSGITPIGQGSATVLTQILADRLQLPLEMIEFTAGDTDCVPDAPGTFASRGATMGGNAACRAADAFVLEARRLAAELYRADLQDVLWKDGALHIRGRSGEPLTIVSLAQQAEARGFAPYTRLNVRALFEDPGVGFASACHAAVVEVDRATGVIRVLDYAITHDCGRIANPSLVEGQIMGGVVQGLGGCLFEVLPFDADGVPITKGYMDYVLPTAACVPRFALHHIETPSPLNSLGMKGAGEAGCSGAVGAVFNAIADAVGAEVTIPAGSGPFTPMLVRELLRNAQSRGAAVAPLSGDVTTTMTGDELMMAYLRRLGLLSRPTATRATLNLMVAAHLQTVPFENLDIVDGLQTELSTAAALNKLIVRGRGGFCYEVNEAFCALLLHLGFNVRRVEARVWSVDRREFGPPYDHLALVVTLPEGEFLTDVGFGDNNRTPMRLPRDTLSDISGRYDLARVRDGRWLLSRTDRPLYELTVAPQHLAAFGPMHRHHQTSPDSLFAGGLICTLATPNGRMTLSRDRFIIMEGGQRTEAVVSDRERVLEQHFGIRRGT